MEGYRSCLWLQKISFRRPRNKASWQMHVFLEEHSLNWSLEEVEDLMEEPEHKLPEEGPRPACQECWWRGREREIGSAAQQWTFELLELHSRTSVTWWIQQSDPSADPSVKVVRQIEQAFDPATWCTRRRRKKLSSSHQNVSARNRNSDQRQWAIE